MFQYHQKNIYPLGPLENLFKVISDKFDGDGASGLVFRLRGNLQSELLVTALKYLQKRHPKLRCCIESNAAGIPCFKVLDSCSPIPILFESSRSDVTRWQDIAQTVLYPPFAIDKGPLIRVCVLDNSRAGITDLFIGFHHSIFDATSGTHFAHELLSAYHALNINNKLPENVSSLPIVISHFQPLTASLLMRCRSFFSLLCYFFQKRWGGSLTKLTSNSTQFSPLIERHIISEEQTRCIIMQCREHDVTLSGAMFAAGMMSLKNTTSGKDKKFSCRFPIDLRGPSGYNIGPEHLGCFVSGFMKVYTLKKDVKFWDLARKGQNNLRQFVKDQGHLTAINLSRFRKNKMDRPHPQRDSISVNNLGILNVNPQYGELGIEEMSLITRRQFIGVYLLIFFHTLNGRLNITFDAVDLPRDFFINYQIEFKRLLYDISNTDRIRTNES